MGISSIYSSDGVDGGDGGDGVPPGGSSLQVRSSQPLPHILSVTPTIEAGLGST